MNMFIEIRNMEKNVLTLPPNDWLYGGKNGGFVGPSE